jgi:hypothetical protein
MMSTRTVLGLIVSVPEEVFSTILTSWLTAKHVALLDSAMCVREHRESFMKAAYGPTVILHMPEEKRISYVKRDAMNMWMMRRCAGMESLHVTNCMYYNALPSREYLLARGPTVREVSFTNKWGTEDPAVNTITSYVAAFCPNLRSFQGERCQSHEALAAIAVGCPLLDKIRFRGGFMDATFDAFAGNCRLLRELIIESDCEFSEPPLVFLLEKCRLLENVTISCKETELTDAFFVALALSCPLLAEVGVGCARINQVSVELLARRCTKLKVLNLEYGSISMTGPLSDAAFPALIDLCFCEVEIGDASLDFFLRCCPKLQTLLLVQLYGLTESGLQGISVHCPMLHTLSLDCSTPAVTDDLLRDLAGHYKQLRSFAAARCELLTDDSVCALIGNSPLLEELDLSECSWLSDTVVYAIAANCPLLRIVFLNGCGGVTAAGVAALLQGCLHLTCLQVVECPQVDEATKQLLEERFFREPIGGMAACNT